MIPIYNRPNPTPALEDALHQALLALSRSEKHIDSMNRPILTEGFRYDTNLMTLTAHIADEGGIPYRDRGPIARKLATQLGYVSVANMMACVREGVSQGLLSATVRDNEGWLMVSDYGWEQLGLYEEMDG